MTIADSPLVAPSIHRYTAEEFVELPGHRGYELEDGILEEMAVGSESTWIAGEIYARIREYAKRHKLGWAFPPEALYQFFADHPDTIRKPNASFIRFGRLQNERIPATFITIAPDIAVEVISPTDTAARVEKKIREYLSAGVRLVWVIYPSTCTARVHRLGKQPSDLSAADELDGEEVLPGFRVRLDQLFPPETNPVKPATAG